ncbi:MAG: DUF2148 domain-containing protein [Clostridiales Family XIII bacterium]|jgi:uncharacterized ferredoxin-like protein|nr:DUF2148 domain-containing protein [Clostridiales Family XIII bacterium]
MIYSSDDIDKEATFIVAKLMLAAIRTAPKGKGVDNIEACIIDGEDKDKLAAEMRRLQEALGGGPFERDSYNVDKSPYVVLIGVKNAPIGMNERCQLCGFPNCAELIKAGSNCVFNIEDFGIAIGSAAAVAIDNRVDNRIMYSIGKAAVNLGFFSETVRVANGIPLSVTGKSPYFDR